VGQGIATKSALHKCFSVSPMAVFSATFIENEKQHIKKTTSQRKGFFSFPNKKIITFSAKGTWNLDFVHLPCVRKKGKTFGKKNVENIVAYG